MPVKLRKVLPNEQADLAALAAISFREAFEADTPKADLTAYIQSEFAVVTNRDLPR